MTNTSTTPILLLPMNQSSQELGIHILLIRLEVTTVNSDAADFYNFAFSNLPLPHIKVTLNGQNFITDLTYKILCALRSVDHY